MSNDKVTIVTAIELDKKSQDEIVKKLQSKVAKSSEFTFLVDQSIVGGIVIRLGATEINCSISQHLATIKNSLHSNL